MELLGTVEHHACPRPGAILNEKKKKERKKKKDITDK